MFEPTNRDWAHFYFDDYDLEAQLIAIRSFLAASRHAEEGQAAEIEALAARANDARSEHIVGMWTDALHASVFHDATRSAAAVGVLAPFIENLFTGIFRGIGRLGEDVLGNDPEAPRAQRARAMFWDPHFYFEKEGEVERNLIQGILQLAKTSALLPHLPGDTQQVLDAVFGYRNQMLHSGFEWPPERREKFAARIGNWPRGWFQKSQQDGKEWIWYMSPQLIDRSLVFIDEVLEAAGQHIRLHLDAKQAAQKQADEQKIQAGPRA